MDAKIKSPVILLRFSSFGDVVLAMEGARALQRLAPGLEVHVVTKEAFAAIPRLLMPSAVVHTISNHAALAEIASLARKLRALKPLMVFDAHNNLRSRMLCSLMAGVNVRRVSKHRLREVWVFARRSLFGSPSRRGYHRVRDLLDLMAPSQEAPLVSEPMGTLPSSAGPQRGRVLCLSLESAWDSKRWPTERFVALAQTLNAQGYGIRWLGLETTPALPSSPTMIDLRSKLSLAETAAQLQQSDGLICNDTGLMHLSEAMGTPVAAVFGPTAATLGFAPRRSDSIIIEKALWCRPCSKNGRMCHRIKEPRKCLADISVQDAQNAVTGWLTKRGAHDSVLRRENLGL